MAVFPDRIVLKNSTDSQTAIVSAIENGGTDAIVPGELVIGRSPGLAELYTLDSAGDVVVISGGGSGGGGRGDGGDFDVSIAQSAFVFGVYGGGDLDTTAIDYPIEFTVGADGGDIT